jgi:hypothetical protein
MKPLFLVFCVAGLLAGCAGNLKLLEDGKVSYGKWNGITRNIEATIDGKEYRGTFERTANVGYGVGFSGAHVGSAVAVGSNGGGQAVLTSEDGKVIQCVFSASFGHGQGQCEGMDGRRFVLVIGD